MFEDREGGVEVFDFDELRCPFRRLLIDGDDGRSKAEYLERARSIEMPR